MKRATVHPGCSAIAPPAAAVNRKLRRPGLLAVLSQVYPHGTIVARFNCGLNKGNAFAALFTMGKHSGCCPVATSGSCKCVENSVSCRPCSFSVPRTSSQQVRRATGAHLRGRQQETAPIHSSSPSLLSSCRRIQTGTICRSPRQGQLRS